MHQINFTPLNNYFDHIYVITLQRDTTRQEKIKTALNGLNFEFLYGADLKYFSVENYMEQGLYNAAEAVKKHRRKKQITKGMLGCTISHRMVYEDVIKNNYQKVLIFEDDVAPYSNSIATFSDIMNQLPPDWELVYFDYNKNTNYNFFYLIKQNWYHIQKLFSGFAHTHKAIKNMYAKSYSTHLKTAGYHDFADAYAITHSAAKKFLNIQTPIVYWSDHLLAYCCANKIVKGFISVPKLFYQESASSAYATESYTAEKK